ncbi:hypothetical protein UYO_1896 [Lachnospiraceae bacterium JC7]|nr:hypothetical protein UYO_1896 [Lachnospiraceae bacterium JC7]
MLDWKTPTPEDIPVMHEIVMQTGTMSSDACVSAIYLLRDKYNIRIAIQDGFLFLWFRENSIPGRNGVTFPLGKKDTSAAMQTLIKDRTDRKLPVQMIFLTEDQVDYLRENKFASDFETHEENWDYLHKAENLSNLGGKNSKKRNKVSRFIREFPDWRIAFTASENGSSVLKDILYVEDEWLSGQEVKTEALLDERELIHEAVLHWDDLSLKGGVIYVSDLPVAMTIASEISPGIFDILYEKSFGNYAQMGGFSAINNLFADYLLTSHHARWINREDDAGIPGLRRAKMDYHPDILLKKYETLIKFT